jgi:uncharacterized protein YjbI with pentapeptide repeats
VLAIINLTILAAFVDLTKVKSKDMDAEEFFRRYEAGERDFSGINLSGANLEGVVLSDVNFVGANLSGTSLCEASLNRVDLSGSELSGASFSEAALVDVNLTGAILTNTFFGEPCMRRVNLTGVDLSEANILWIENERRPKGIILCHTTMPDGTIRNDHCT